MKILIVYYVKLQINKYFGCIINTNDKYEGYLIKWKDIKTDKNVHLSCIGITGSFY